jgi:hypothetical protein
MRSLPFAIALTMLAACGSSSSPKTGVDAPTSTTQHDAPASTTVDAPATAMAAMGLGKVCDQTHACPTTGATTCVALTSGATHGFCTLSCGSGAVPAAGADPQPPAGGDAICMGSTPAPVGLRGPLRHERHDEPRQLPRRPDLHVERLSVS